MTTTPLVLIDFRVYAWDINFKVRPLIESEIIEEEELKKLIKALWAYKINRGPDFMDLFDHRIVVVTDCKNEQGDYWRSHYVRDDNRIKEAWEKWVNNNKRRKKPLTYEYKGNRKDRDDISDILSIGREYVKTYIGPIYELKGFEADDWACTVHSLKKEATSNPLKDREIYLSTIDRDWSQLVDDDLKIYMSNTRKPSPRERFQDRLITNRGVIDHTEHYSKHKINHPSELPYVKQKVGDFGDNLPPNSPLEYFDLINPPIKITGDIVYNLLQDLQSNEVNQQIDHLKRSELYITKLGFPHLC